MKASDIKNKALAEIIAHAKYEMHNIIDQLIRKGMMAEDEEGIYEVNLSDCGIKTKYTYDVWVEDICGEFYTEKRTLLGFQLDADGVFVLAEEEDYDKQDPIALRALSFDDIVGLTDVLEEMWTTLIKGKK